MVIRETLDTEITKQCDVLVCGGGFAGIAASLAAARLGKKVILLEREFLLGGLGTAGLVTIYLPLCDGMGHQVSFGIAEELLRLSVSLGAEADYPHNWLDSTDAAGRTKNDRRFEVRYNPQLFAILAEQLLLKEGVEILYGSCAAAVEKADNRIRAVIVESKSKRYAIRAASVVDATGDCDIAFFAGAKTRQFGQGNLLAAWYYSSGKKGYQLHPLGCADIPEDQKNGKNDVKTLADQRFTGLDGEEISGMVRQSHAVVLKHILEARKEDPSMVPVTLATIPQIRMTRKLVGEYTLSDTEVHTRFEDSVGMVSDWRKRGPVYEVPFRSLYTKEVKNLITAGRCVSVTDSMWDILRVIPCCAVTGQAAGTAAALTDDFASLPVTRLQQELTRSGVILHEEEIL